MNEQPSKIGIIGAGFISSYHIQGLQQAGGQVLAIASRTETSAHRQAARFGIPEYMSDYREILSNPLVDAVVIATPDFTHEQYAIHALQAGKAVLLQKPMARSSAECRRIIAAAQSSGVPLYVSFMHRYFEEIEAIRRLLVDDALGRVHSVRHRNATPGADWAAWFYSKDNVGGGVMLQLGVHGIDLLRHVFGEIESVKATTMLAVPQRMLADGTVVRPDNEDTVLATYRFASGVIAAHECSYAEMAGTDRFRMEIYGTDGTAWLRTERGRLSLYAPGYLQRAGWFTPDLPAEQVGYRQHRHFLEMLRGEVPPDDSARDGLVSVLVAEAVYRSAASDQWEQVTV